MYQYKAYTLDKQIVEGTIDAPSEDLAEERLLEAGYRHILTLKKTALPLSLERLLPGLYGVKKSDIIDFFSQLATLIDARVPFVQALWILAEQANRPALKVIINKLGQQVSSGISFSQALAQYPKLVSGHYCQVISVSEKSGDLTRGLRMVAGYMEKELNTTGNIRRMLSYPAFLGFMSLIVIVIIAIVAMPSLIKLFTALRVELPLVTRILIATANFFTDYKYYLLAGLVILVFIIMALKDIPGIKGIFDKLSLKLPVMGNIVIMRNICRFCRGSAMLIEAGLTLPQSFNAIIGIIDNGIIKQVLTEIRQEIIKGKGLSRQMGKSSLFPRLLVDVVSIGEKTGTLESSFSTMADYYEKRLDMKIRKLLGMIEPASIIIVGLIISFIGVAIIMPLYSIYQTV